MHWYFFFNREMKRLTVIFFGMHPSVSLVRGKVWRDLPFFIKRIKGHADSLLGRNCDENYTFAEVLGRFGIFVLVQIYFRNYVQ
jgi:hypothetical protein